MRFQYNGMFLPIDPASATELNLRSPTFVSRFPFKDQSIGILFPTDLPPLYKKTSGGDWQEMRFSLEINAKGAWIVKNISSKSIAPRKYVTKIKEVGSKLYSDVVQERLQGAWNKKRNRDGWVEDKNERVLHEPMLLHHIEDNWNHIQFPALISPKLNGVRCTYLKDHGMLSRKRNILPLERIFKECQTVSLGTLDGELWSPAHSFEEIVGMVKKGDDILLEYHIFDCPDIRGGYVDRIAKVIQAVTESGLPRLKVVPVALVDSPEAAEHAHKAITQNMKGIDGSVIRNLNGPYAWNTRSRDVLKVKEVISKEYKCVGYSHDDDPLGRLITFYFKIGDGDFKVIPNWPKQARVQAYQHGSSFVGKMFTLEFREFTSGGIPKHILTCNVRDYE